MAGGSGKGEGMKRHHLVLPGPRKSEMRRRRLRYFAAGLLIVVVALGWLGYRELFGASGGVWFSGP